MKLTFKDKQKTLFKRLKYLKENATESEIYIKKLLDMTDIKYIFQKGFIQGDYYCIVDFYLPKPYKVCIEIDGGYHTIEKQIKRDQRKDDYLKSRNFKILRITNREALLFDDLMLKKIIELL